MSCVDYRIWYLWAASMISQKSPCLIRHDWAQFQSYHWKFEKHLCNEKQYLMAFLMCGCVQRGGK